MDDSMVNKVHWSFWVISIFMLIWNAAGCVNFFVQMNPEMVSSYLEAEQAIIAGRPLWATAGFAIAVFGGAIGCILLLLKNATSLHLLIVSLVGVLIATVHSLTVDINFGLGEIIGVVIMPTVVAILMIWYCQYVKGKGWLSTT
jgi:hypothetical protein